MLQIVTKMYFKGDANVRATTHRDVLYSNCTFLSAEVVDLPVGSLASSTSLRPVSTMTVSVVEHMEVDDSGNSGATLVATGGQELIDDLAAVLSFGLGAVFSRNADLVRRLVPDTIGSGHQTQASRLFGPMFEANRYVSADDLTELRRFMTELLALRRPHFDAVMRAIRRIIGATQRAADDPTLAYVDIVAALESLSGDAEGVAITWDRFDHRKRKLIDEALTQVAEDVAHRVRTAVLEAERAGIRARFSALVMNNVGPDFYRSQATGLTDPIRARDLDRMVKHAYVIRSQNVHSLRELDPETWLPGTESETVLTPGGDRMLTHRGLARLTWHVLKNYVAAAPTGVDETFDWRAFLPGRLLMRAAPQYWIWHADGLNQQTVDAYFTGFVQVIVEAIAGRVQPPDTGDVLDRIEVLLAQGQRDSARQEMIAIYVLWHRLAPGELHRPDAVQFLAKYGPELQRPALAGFITWLILRELPEWTAEQWQALAEQRREARAQRNHLELQPALDAALLVAAAEQLAKAGSEEQAREYAAYAVEELPGSQPLIAWEAALTTDVPTALNLWDLVIQPETPDESETQTDAADEPHEAELDGPSAGMADASDPDELEQDQPDPDESNADEVAPVEAGAQPERRGGTINEATVSTAERVAQPDEPEPEADTIDEVD